MAYYSGVANSYADLKSALFTHAQSDGWARGGTNDDVLSKGGVYFRVITTAASLAVLGVRNNSLNTPAPGVVQLGRLAVDREVSFPVAYHIFGFDQELYLVVNYDVEYYQWMAFGKSSVPGLLGSGAWCGATYGYKTGNGGGGGNTPISISATGGGASGWNSGADGATCAALFWHTRAAPENEKEAVLNCWVDHGLYASPWWLSNGASAAAVGVRYLSELIQAQPSTWNSESVLLPLRCHVELGEFKSAMVADLEHARHIRIDHYQPRDIITLGSDRWMVLPWYRRNTLARNGSAPGNLPTAVNDHTGTFGWAIRYEGP